VTVQTARPVSNSVEAQLAVRHETPQAIVVRSGKAVWTASHRAITRRSLQAALSSHT
jgi:bacillithiol system protein YtxJ